MVDNFGPISAILYMTQKSKMDPASCTHENSGEVLFAEFI